MMYKDRGRELIEEFGSKEIALLYLDKLISFNEDILVDILDWRDHDLVDDKITELRSFKKVLEKI